MTACSLTDLLPQLAAQGHVRPTNACRLPKLAASRRPPCRNPRRCLNGCWWARSWGFPVSDASSPVTLAAVTCLWNGCTAARLLLSCRYVRPTNACRWPKLPACFACLCKRRLFDLVATLGVNHPVHLCCFSWTWFGRCRRQRLALPDQVATQSLGL